MSVFGYTSNYSFRLIRFDDAPWHEDEYANWRLLDTLIASSLSIPTIDGNWANSTLYAVGDRLYDEVAPNIYECQVGHTSAATPTSFAEDRTAHPTYWSLVTIGMVWKGQWLTGVSYQQGDLVFQAGSTYMCKEAHVSNVFATDLAAVKWELFAQQGVAGAGTGDVVGPASSVDNRVALFDGITGKLLKDSGVLLSALALLASPIFTGTPTAPTAAPGTNTTQLATTAFIEAVRVALINGAPATLDTLDELAAAINDDPAFFTTINTALALKAPINNPTFTGTVGGLPVSSETVQGIVELATTAEAEAGTDTARAITAAGLLAAISGKQTIFVPAAAMWPRTSNGCAQLATIEMATNKNTHKTLDFDATSLERAQFAIQMPKSWDEGTIIAQFVWSHASTTTNFGVSWQLAAVAMSDDDAGDVAMGTAVLVSDTGGTTNDIYISGETAAITVGGSPAAQDWVLFDVARDPTQGSDTMAIDARLLGVKIHLNINAFTDD